MTYLNLIGSCGRSDIGLAGLPLSIAFQVTLRSSEVNRQESQGSVAVSFPFSA